MKEDELSNQLKSQNLDTVLPTSLKQVGGAVFPDVPTVGGLAAFRHVVDSYRAVHLPSYGSPIAGSFKVVSINGNETILTPGTNQVARVQSISFENQGGAAPIVLNLVLGSTTIAVGVTVGPAAIVVPDLGQIYPIFFDKSLPLSVLITSGSAGDLVTEAIYSLIAQ